MEKLLNYEGDASDLDLTFSVPVDRFGKIEIVELVNKGSEIAVTNENKHEYVRLYTKYILIDSISRQFLSFSTGFFKVTGGPIIQVITQPKRITVIYNLYVHW